MLFIPFSFTATQTTDNNKQPQYKKTDIYPCRGTDCQFYHLIELVQGIVGRLFKYAMILSPIVIIWAGALYIWSAQDPQSRSKANKMLKSVVIGLAIMMLSWTLVTLFLKSLANDEVLKISPIKQ